MESKKKYYFEPHVPGGTENGDDINCMICGSWALYMYMIKLGKKPEWKPNDVDIRDATSDFDHVVFTNQKIEYDVRHIRPLKSLKGSDNSITNLCVNRDGFFAKDKSVLKDIKHERMHVHPFFVLFPRSLNKMFWPTETYRRFKMYVHRGFEPVPGDWFDKGVWQNPFKKLHDRSYFPWTSTRFQGIYTKLREDVENIIINKDSV